MPAGRKNVIHLDKTASTTASKLSSCGAPVLLNARNITTVVTNRAVTCWRCRQTTMYKTTMGGEAF